jgi:hypothetical protein
MEEEKEVPDSTTRTHNMEEEAPGRTTRAQMVAMLATLLQRQAEDKEEICKDLQPIQVQTSVHAAQLLLYPFINRYSPTCPLVIPRFPAPISGNLYSKRVSRQEPGRAPFTTPPHFSSALA